jgi:hypothetical protein
MDGEYNDIPLDIDLVEAGGLLVDHASDPQNWW